MYKEGDKSELTVPRGWPGHSYALHINLADLNYNIFALGPLIAWRALEKGSQDEEPVKETVAG